MTRNGVHELLALEQRVAQLCCRLAEMPFIISEETLTVCFQMSIVMRMAWLCARRISIAFEPLTALPPVAADAVTILRRAANQCTLVFVTYGQLYQVCLSYMYIFSLDNLHKS